MFFGRIHPHKGTAEAIDVAERAGLPLTIAGIVQDQEYFDRAVEPRIDGDRVRVHRLRSGPTSAARCWAAHARSCT